MRCTLPIIIMFLLCCTKVFAQNANADLLGKWSIDCEKAHIELFEQNGQLMQKGFVDLTEFPIPSGILKPSPVIVKRNDNKLVLMSKIPVGQVKVKTMIRAVKRTSQSMQVIDILGCMAETCETIPVNQTMGRCT